jgi:peptide/nickel transport system permease protein
MIRSRWTTGGYIGLAIMAAFAGIALVGAFWTPFDPLQLNFGQRLRPPSSRHWLGTDEFGRDVLSRIMAGAATSFQIALLTALLATAAGAVLGLVMGFFRGWPDRILSIFTDALLAFPGILLALGFLAIFGANENGILAALGLAYAPVVARVVRGAVMSLREKEFVEASSVMGNGALTTMMRHVLPNTLSPILVMATSLFGFVLLAESALSFLGIGVPPPAPTWGNMLATGRPFIEHAVWLGIFPGLCISFSLLGVNLLGDALRDRLDPRNAS